MDKRIGKIVVACELIYKIGIDEFKSALKGITIIESRYNPINDTNEYIAMSDKFDEIIDGQAIQQYTVAIDKNKNVVVDKVSG